MKRRLLSLVLILAIILTYIPMDAELVLADWDYADGWDCERCGKYIWGDYVCDDCGRHSPDSGDDCAEFSHCSVCGACLANTEFCDFANICMDCVSSEGFHCAECGECDCGGTGEDLCGECWRCESCVDICPDCGFCEECALNTSDTHCPLCNNCYSTVGDCVDGETTHCEECCRVCESCGECLTDEEAEFCDICGLCVDCCLLNAENEGCTCEEYCIESSEWPSHICDNCGQCFDQEDQCELCGYCLDCCASESECIEGLCVEDNDYDSHFCEDCGRCFHEVNECDTCVGNGELRCEECCEEYCIALGCTCPGQCVSDPGFEDHLTEFHADEKGRSHTKTPQKFYSVDGNYHWYYCSFCNVEEHITGKGLHSYNSIEECKVCGYKKGAAVYITMQPKDAISIPADANEYSKDTDEDDLMVLTKKFSVKASGSGKLSYQWYSMVEGATTGKAVINTSDIEKHLGNAKSGATSDTVEMYVSEDLCYAPIKLYCIVSDEAGHSVKSAVATLYGEHNYACITNIKDTSKSQVTYTYVTDNNVTKTVSYYPSLGHNYECTGDYNHSTNRYKYNNPRRHIFTSKNYLGILKDNANAKVYSEKCDKCGYVEYYVTHNHVWEDDPTKILEATNEAGEDVYTKYHVLKCTYPGCEQTKEVAHTYKPIHPIGYPTRDGSGTEHPAGYYRECSVCEYQDDTVMVGQDGKQQLWTTKNMLISSDSSVKISKKLATDRETIYLSYTPSVGADGKYYKCVGWEMSYTYLTDLSNGGSFATKDLTPLIGDDGIIFTKNSTNPKEWSFVMPMMKQSPAINANYGGKVTLTPVLEECKQHSRTIEGKKKAVCCFDGYEGDLVCRYCGYVYAKGNTIESAGKHTGTLTLVPGTARSGDCTKRSQKYAYEGDYKCSDCGKIIQGKRTRVHNNVVEKNDGVAATCTTTGLTNTKYCTACGKTVKSQRVIPVTHKNTKVTGEVAATCTTTGFSGQVTCKDCGALVDEGHYTKVLGHEGGTATCTAKKVCTRCGESYGAYAAHTVTTLEQVKATLTTDGNTGDKVCSVCERKLQTSETVYKPETFTLSKTKYTYNGKSQKPTVTVKDSKGNTLVKNTDYTLKYKYTVDAGTAYVYIYGAGNYEYTKKLKYTINKNNGSSLTYTLPDTKIYYDGTEKKPVVTVKNASGTDLELDTDYTVAYSNNIKVGTATITVTGIGNYSYTKTINFTIEENSASKYTYKLSTTEYVYDGKGKKPSVTVKDSKGKTLVKNTDYTLSYENYVNAGTATVIVTGKGSYAFEKRIDYTIKVNDGSACTFNLSATSFTYDGNEQKPTVTIVNSASVTLVEGKDYTVAYANNINVGTATATITGKGNYSFTKVLEFAITGKDDSTLTFKLSSTKYMYDGNAKKPSVTVRDEAGNALVKNTDYTIKYKYNVDAGTAYVIVYGAGGYSYTKKIKFTITPNDGASCTYEVLEPSIGYDGNAKEPAVSIMNGAGNALVKGTDFTLSYSNNINVGTATVIATGIGNYSFTKSLTFEIVKGSYAVSVKKYNGTYDGKYHTVTISGVKDGSTIEYRTSANKDWGPTKPSRKTVGRTVVYYQITNPNYETISAYSTIIINPVGTSLTTLTGVSKGFKAVWTKQASQTTGYEIEYSTSSSFATSEKETVEGTSQTTVQITGLPSSKKYYVRIRTYHIISDKYYYSTWSETKTVSTK